MKRALTLLAAIVMLLPATAVAQPGHTITAPYYEMFRERQWCSGMEAANCYIDDNAQTWDGALANGFGVRGTNSDETPISQKMTVGFWMPVGGRADQRQQSSNRHGPLSTRWRSVRAAHT